MNLNDNTIAQQLQISSTNNTNNIQETKQFHIYQPSILWAMHTRIFQQNGHVFLYRELPRIKVCENVII